MPHTLSAGEGRGVPEWVRGVTLLACSDCAVHGPALARSEERRTEGVPGRKMSSVAGRAEVENCRKSSNARSSSSSRSSSPARSSPSTVPAPVIYYHSMQYVTQRIPR